MSATRSFRDVKLFLSSRMAEFCNERLALRQLVDEKFPGHQLWTWEGASSIQGHPESIFLSQVEQSDIVIILLGKEVSPAVYKEITRARETGRRLIVFHTKEGLGTDVQELLEQLGAGDPKYPNCTPVKYRPWSDLTELVECVRVSLEDMRSLDLQDSYQYRAQVCKPQPETGIAFEFEATGPTKIMLESLMEHCNAGNLDLALRLVDTEQSRLGSTKINAEILNAKAFVLRRMARFTESIAASESAMSISNSPRHKVTLISTLSSSGQLERANQIADELAEYQLELPLIGIMRSRFLLSKGEVAEATELALRLWPNRGRAGFEFWMLLLDILSINGRFKAVLMAAKRAATSCPSASRLTYLHQAHAHLELFRDTEEQQRMEDALALLFESTPERMGVLLVGPDALEYWSWRHCMISTEALVLGGELEIAEARLQEVLDANPNDEIVRANLAQLNAVRSGSYPDWAAIDPATFDHMSDRHSLFMVALGATMSYANGTGPEEDALEALQRLRERFPGYDGVTIVQLVLSLHANFSDKEVNELRALSVDESRHELIRSNAALLATTILARNYREEAAIETVEAILGTTATCPDLVCAGMQLAFLQARTDTLNLEKYRRALRIAEEAIPTLRRARKRLSIVQPQTLANLGEIVWRICRILDCEEFASEMSDQFRQFSPGNWKQQFDGGMARAML